MMLVKGNWLVQLQKRIRDVIETLQWIHNTKSFEDIFFFSVCPAFFEDINQYDAAYDEKNLDQDLTVMIVD